LYDGAGGTLVSPAFDWISVKPKWFDRRTRQRRPETCAVPWNRNCVADWTGPPPWH